jgi:hypothetical protein
MMGAMSSRSVNLILFGSKIKPEYPRGTFKCAVAVFSVSFAPCASLAPNRFDRVLRDGPGFACATGFNALNS